MAGRERDMFRKYESGSAKRQKKRKHEELINKQSGSIKRFISLKMIILLKISRLKVIIIIKKITYKVTKKVSRLKMKKIIQIQMKISCLKVMIILKKIT